MGALLARTSPSVKAARLPKELMQIKLHYGEAVWVMSRLGFQGKASDQTFYEYIKSLRKLDIPFEKVGRGYRGLVSYSYFHLMELALVLMARVYYFVPDAVLAEIVRHRPILYRYYRRAYLDRSSGIGAPVRITPPQYVPIVARGVFLDLQIDFSGGVLTRFGPPVLLSPSQALATFVNQEDVAARALLPLNLSVLAERVVLTALRAPRVRRGPHSVANNARGRKSRQGNSGNGAILAHRSGH